LAQISLTEVNNIETPVLGQLRIMKKPTIILALLTMLTASSLLAKGSDRNCGGGGNGGGGGSVPDAASTAAMLTIAVGAVGAGRRFFRR